MNSIISIYELDPSVDEDYPPDRKKIAALPLRDVVSSNSVRQLMQKSDEFNKFQKFENMKFCERSYEDFYAVSDGDRKDRAKNVYVRPPENGVDQYGNSMIRYNFKSKDSTTGNRQKGFIIFLSDSEDQSTAPVEVYCSCPDFKYRYAYTNWKDKSAPKPSNSKNRQFPRKTNPSGDVGLCKHLLAARDYIIGMDFV